MTPEEFRARALALPDAVELDHHGRPSFRVGPKGKIFATLWADDLANVMLDEPGIRAAVEEQPGVCTAFMWGQRRAAVQIELSQADAGLVADLLAEAWERRRR